jgi:two-component system, NarL family, sensor histidine kinase DegS
MALTTAEKSAQVDWDALLEVNQHEIGELRNQLKEVAQLIAQSRQEVDRLAQRNADITVRLGQVQINIETVPREEIRKAYEAALDTQGRLFNMRGRLENLQNDQQHMQQRLTLLERIHELLESGKSQELRAGDISAGVETLEMLVQTQEAERQRLSRQMHDGPAQSLSNFILQTEIALRLFDKDQDQAREELNSLKDTATSSFRKVRDFIFELRPMMLDDLGLVPTIKKYTQAFQEQNGIETTFTLSGNERRLQPYLEVLVFRAVQELLANAASQGRATQVKVHLDMAETHLRVNLEDNGRGFELGQIEKSGGMGLKMIQDRIALLEGTFQVDSIPGQGTRIHFQIPTAVAPQDGQAVSGN